MCGLVGIISPKRTSSDSEKIALEMLKKISHRGPDGHGLQKFPSKAVFAHCRLSIIDRDHGDQPMLSEDGRYALVYNGEIYNYLELRQSLIQKGHRFSTYTDTEVLLHLLVEEGAAALSQLNGMFSFLFFDSLTNEWIAAVDPFGIKPFYYTKLEDEFIFASEIKSLLAHPLVPAARDNQSLQQYLTFQFCLKKRTLFKGIFKLEPGHLISGCGNEIKSEKCYWDTNYEIDYYHTEDFFTDRLRDLITDSVRIQLRSDVPLGGYLSGGLDSSLVCTLAAGHLDSLPMFHGRFAEGTQYDESDYAKEVAHASKGKYFEVVPTANGFVEKLPGIIYMLDEPLAGPGVFPQYEVSLLASNYVTVILGGQGGDEVFGGYARYLIGYLEQALKGAIFETQDEGKHLVTLESIIPQLPLLQQYQPLLAQFWSQGLFESMDSRYFRLIDRSQNVQNFLNSDVISEFNVEQVFSDFQEVFNYPTTPSYINKMTHFDLKTLLPALLQIEDRVSMTVSMESRVPLLDTRIVDLVNSQISGRSNKAYPEKSC
jgi:asparagine synthase (glutamine-hydrolysing)